MSEEKEYLGPSLDPEDAISGGLFDNHTVTFGNCHFEMFDYNGTQDPSPVLSIDMMPEGGDEVYTQKYSVGKAMFWTPTDDTKWIKPLTETEREIRKNSNVNYFMKSLKEGGMPMTLLKDRDVSAMNGLKAHVMRKEIAGRDDLQQGKETTRRGADGKEYKKDNKILLVERVISLPAEGDKKGDPAGKKAAAGKKATAKKTAAKEDAPDAAPGDLNSAQKKAKEFITKQIMEGNGKVDKKVLPNAAFQDQSLAVDPERNAVLVVLFQNQNILDLGGFAIDDAGVITLG